MRNGKPDTDPGPVPERHPDDDFADAVKLADRIFVDVQTADVAAGYELAERLRVDTRDARHAFAVGYAVALAVARSEA